MTIASLIVSVGTNTVDFENGIKKVHGSLEATSGIASKMGTMLAGAFTVTAITGAATRILDYADKVQTLSQQTGLTTRTIQEMEHAAKTTNTTLEAFTNAAFKLGVNLDGGSGSVRSAVDRLGLSYTSLKAMSPDQQFDTIAEALGRVHNSQERNTLSLVFFGKSAKDILPAIDEGWRKVADGATIAGDAQIKALADLAGHLDTFNAMVMAYGTNFAGYVVNAVHDVGKVLLIPFKEVGSLFGKLGDAVAYFSGSTQSAAAPVAALSSRTLTLTRSFDQQNQSMKALTVAHGAATTSTKKWTQAAEDAKNVGVIWGDGLSDFDHLMADHNITIGTYVTKAHSAEDATADLWEQFFRLTKQVQTINPALLTTSMNLGAMIEPLKATVKAVPTGAQWGTAWGGMKEGLSGVLQSVPATMARAFEGGGNVMGAVQSIAGQVGSTLGGGIGFMMGGPLGASVGQAVGSLAGPLVGKIAGLFKDSVKEAVKVANGEIAKVQEGLLGTYGTLENLEAMANAVGLSFVENWGHQGEAGLAAFKALAEDFEARVEAMKANLGTLSTELEGVFNQARDIGYEFDKTGQLTGVSFEKMQEKAKAYGVDLGSLGPSFQSARLHASAMEIINDFELLTRGGADVGGVLVGMSGEISNLVNDSIKFGTAIPANMQPWIAELLRTGQLTDENGAKIEDLSGIKFGEAVGTEFERISSKIVELIESIATLVANLGGVHASARDSSAALDAMARDRSATITIRNRTENEVVDVGGGGESEGWASGTISRGSWFRNFGAGTPTVLHGSEAVVRRDQAGAFAEAVGGGSDGKLDRLIRDLPRAMKIALSDAMVMAR